MLERMRFGFPPLILIALTAVFLATLLCHEPAHAKSKAVPKARADVNYDDPNLVFTSDYVVDTAANCDGLKAKALRKCLIANGLASDDAPIETPPALPNAAKTTRTSSTSIH